MTTQAKASPSFATASTSSSSSFLVLVLDLNPLPCTQASSSHDILSILIPSVLVFLNAHLALSHSNGVAVYACSTGGLAKLIYSTASHSHNAKYTERESSQALQDASTYQHFALLGKAVVQGIKATLSEMEAADKIKENARPPEEEETALVKVLSMALNHLNRIYIEIPIISAVSYSNPLPSSRATMDTSSKNASSARLESEGSGSCGIDSRILILSSTASASDQYIGLMNCIFASQRRGIPIDVLKVQGGDTVFLQQATNLTGGIYFRLVPTNDSDTEANGNSFYTPAGQQRLLQTLMTTYLPPPASRDQLFNLPTLDEVDFRASCFCHGIIVDVGYVCGVCLSIFCHPPLQCFICNSRFPKRTLQRYHEDLTTPRAPRATADNGVSAT